MNLTHSSKESNFQMHFVIVCFLYLYCPFLAPSPSLPSFICLFLFSFGSHTLFSFIFFCFFCPIFSLILQNLAISKSLYSESLLSSLCTNISFTPRIISHACFFLWLYHSTQQNSRHFCHRRFSCKNFSRSIFLFHSSLLFILFPFLFSIFSLFHFHSQTYSFFSLLFLPVFSFTILLPVGSLIIIVQCSYIVENVTRICRNQCGNVIFRDSK